MCSCSSPINSAPTGWVAPANEVLQTPNIDRIAAAGVRFSRAYCANPVCMPSRATLMTGLLPSDHGVRANGINLSPHAVVLPETLRRAGYRTTLVGKPHFSCWWTTPDRTPNIDRYDRRPCRNRATSGTGVP